MNMTTLTKETAGEFDFIIGLDASASMNTPSTRYADKTRWEEAQETIFGIASTLGKYDDDGIDIVVFGGRVDVHQNVTAAKVADIFASREPHGSTPLAEAVAKVVAKQAHTKKNTVAIFFTDGAPDDQGAVVNVIKRAAESIEEDKNLTFLFVQIGTDPGASRFLKHLDDNLNAKFDIVDTVSAAEAESMTSLELVNKAIND